MWTIIILIAVVIIYGIVRYLFRSEKHSTLLSGNPPQTTVKEGLAPVDMTLPDRPTVFGYKGTWLAVKGNDVLQIATVAGIRDLQPCNWAWGVEQAYVDGVFLTPPIDGWTLLLGVGSFPDADTNESIREIKQLLNELSRRFGEAQYFATHRGVGYAAWLRSANGIITRAYSIANGRTYVVEGSPTAFEQGYHWINTLSKEAEGPDYFERQDVTYPDEEDVMAIAGAWSVNPSTLEDRQDLIPSLGFIGNR